MLLLERLFAPHRIRARREALLREQPLVIMGRGKSGTRLVAFACQNLGVAMGTSDRLKAGDVDDRRFLQTIKRLACRNLDVERLEQVRENDLLLLQREVARLRGKLLAGSPGAKAWGWKWPETYLIAPYVLATFPRARFLHLVRDGRDIAFNRHLTDDPRRALGRALLRRIGALGEPHHLQAARSWQFQVERFRRFAAALPPAQRHELRYETLCREPAGSMQRVAEFLELPFTEACRQYVTDVFASDRIALWRREDPQRVREVEAAIGGTLRALGYPLGAEAPA